MGATRQTTPTHRPRYARRLPRRPERALAGTLSLGDAASAAVRILGQLVCPKTGADRRIIAFVTDAAFVERMLNHTGEPRRPHPIAPARRPPAEQERPEPVPDLILFGQPEPASSTISASPGSRLLRQARARPPLCARLSAVPRILVGTPGKAHAYAACDGRWLRRGQLTECTTPATFLPQAIHGRSGRLGFPIRFRLCR